MKNVEKYYLRIRKMCPNCKSVLINYNKYKCNYLCTRCNKQFSIPISMEKLHNNMGICVERPRLIIKN